jgi:outer membrane protein TolC
MLDEGRGYVVDELSRVETELPAGGGGVTEADRFRLRAAIAEVDARIAEVRRIEQTALAGVRFFFDGEVDVDEDALVPLEEPAFDRAEARRRATQSRPERRAAEAGVEAAAQLAALERARWWPDLIAVGQGAYARDSAADDPQNAFFADPLNVSSLSVGVAARWTIDLGSRPAKIHEAEAGERRAAATLELAERGVVAETDRAWADVVDARTRLGSSAGGEKAARSWLVANLQAAEAGLIEPRELTDSVISWFTMRARLLQATFDWNVAVMSLARATGQAL